MSHAKQSTTSKKGDFHSFFHFIRVIACAHASIRATSWMRVKSSTPTSVYNTYCLGRNEKNERKIKNIKLNGYHFSLTFVNILLG